MKNLITILVCAFCLTSLCAQNADGSGRQIPQPTPEIQVLNAQEHALKAAGDVAGLEANRQALIAAWQAIDPAIAAEYKPIIVSQTTSNYIPKTLQTRTDVPLNDNPLWGGDLILNSHFNDGVDLETALNGTIYVASYENKVRYGNGNDEITIYKSTDNGTSFSEWGSASTPDDINKMKLTLMDKPTTQYLFTTYLSVDGKLQNLRFNLAGGPLDSETIQTGLKDFDIDVDYQFVTAAQLYAVYIKSDDGIYTAASSGGSFGFNWINEHNLGYGARACALTYGYDSTFVSFIGYNTGNLYFASNTSYNSPTGWNTPIVITNGAVRESLDISLRTERKSYTQYRAVLLASQRATGSTGAYTGVGIKINNDETFTSEDIVNSMNVRYWDSWAKRTDGSDIIQTSFDNVDAHICKVKKYQNGIWDNSQLVSDNPLNTGSGLSAVAGDVDNNAIAAYIGGTKLYFDTNRGTAGVQDNSKNTLVYYPNPFTSKLNLKAQSPISNVAIYNLLGQQVKTLKPESVSSNLDMADLSSGTYIMKVTMNGEVGNYKIIKN